MDLDTPDALSTLVLVPFAQERVAVIRWCRGLGSSAAQSTVGQCSIWRRLRALYSAPVPLFVPSDPTKFEVAGRIVRFVPMGPVGVRENWRGVHTTLCEELPAALPTCGGIIVVCSVRGQRFFPPLTMRVYALAAVLRAIDENSQLRAVPIVYYDADPVLVSKESLLEWDPEAHIPVPSQPESVPQWLARVAPDVPIIDMTGSDASFIDVVAAARIPHSAVKGT